MERQSKDVTGEEVGSSLAQKQDRTPSPAVQSGQSIEAPSISLPKGGAIRSIREKFAANPVTGNGSMTVPIAASPGQSGFDPQLSLFYDSGAINELIGIGWNLSLAAIPRKTDKGLSKYQGEESDLVGIETRLSSDLELELELELEHKDIPGKNHSFNELNIKGGRHGYYCIDIAALKETGQLFEDCEYAQVKKFTTKLKKVIEPKVSD